MLDTTFADHVATITIRTRTMTPAFFGAVGDAFREVSKNPDLRAVVLRSDQKAFSYGLDLQATFASHGDKLMGAPTAGPRHELRQMIRDWQAGFTAVAECPVPVICAINSWCIGGGLDLASACDIRLVTADTRISLREVKLAIVADLGSLQRLPGIIGIARTKEMAYTGRDVAADEALAMGLANAVLPDVEALHAEADRMAREIAGNAPRVVQGIKHIVDWGADKSIAAGLDYVATWNSAFLASSDLGEAVSAFMAKREPVFSGD